MYSRCLHTLRDCRLNCLWETVINFPIHSILFIKNNYCFKFSYTNSLKSYVGIVPMLESILKFSWVFSGDFWYLTQIITYTMDSQICLTLPSRRLLGVGMWLFILLATLAWSLSLGTVDQAKYFTFHSRNI